MACRIQNNIFIERDRTIFFGVVSIAQLVEMTDSAVLGGVAEVMSSNPTVGHKIGLYIENGTWSVLIRIASMRRF